MVRSPPHLGLEQAPSFGSLTLLQGFVPDPQGMTGIAGGPLRADGLGRRCRGWIQAEPGHVVRLQTPFEQLQVYVRSPLDTTLIVRLPDGRFVCDDDGGRGSNPRVVESYWIPGDYRIWVGSQGPDQAGPYQVFFTELPHDG